jgi:hypothetical protein
MKRVIERLHADDDVDTVAVANKLPPPSQLPREARATYALRKIASAGRLIKLGLPTT